MKTERRWLKSIIAAAADETQAALPFARSMRRRPASLNDRGELAPSFPRAAVMAYRPTAQAAR